MYSFVKLMKKKYMRYMSQTLKYNLAKKINKIGHKYFDNHYICLNNHIHMVVNHAQLTWPRGYNFLCSNELN